MKVKFKDALLVKYYTAPMEELGKQGISNNIIKHFRRKIDILKQASDLRTIAQIRGLNLEKMQEKRYEGCLSIRVNKQYRIIFKQDSDDEISVLILELSKHYE